MSYLCHICQFPFTRSFNLRRHLERVHKHSHGDLEMNSENSKRSMVKRPYDSSNEGSYEDVLERDSSNSVSGPLEEDDMTDSSETDSTDDYSDTERADISEDESEENGIETDNDGEEEDRRDKVSCPIDAWEALVKMNKAMVVILKRGHKISISMRLFKTKDKVYRFEIPESKINHLSPYTVFQWQPMRSVLHSSDSRESPSKHQTGNE